MDIQLSICIPVYQRSVENLVSSLRIQAAELPVNWEILLWDDGSEESVKTQNRPLARNENIRYHELERNAGRSRIRNLLMEAARGKFLLFLDNDSEIISSQFLNTYWQNRLEGGVICGGHRIDEAQNSPEYRLHFGYAQCREVQNVSQRNTHPAKGFHSNNFLMSAAVPLKFDESLKQYGHEDTLFGMELARQNIPVKHIDNPVLHGQLESNADFLAKTRMGLENLAFLLHGKNDLDLNFFPLLKMAVKLQKYWLAGLYRFWFHARKRSWIGNLQSSRPSLKIFDFYRLGYLLTQIAEKRP